MSFSLIGVGLAGNLDYLPTAVQKANHSDVFIGRYRDLLNYYGMEGCHSHSGRRAKQNCSGSFYLFCASICFKLDWNNSHI